MRRLVIECATEACSVALFDGDECMANDHAVLGRGHAERLVPMIASLPDNGRAQIIAVSRGPGSFTGVRIGIAAARALGVAWQAEVLGFPTLALVAALARRDTGPVPVRVVMTGGHGEWFVQDFGADGLPLAPHASLTPDAAADLAKSELAVGSQAEAFIEAQGSGKALALLPDARAFPSIPESLVTTDSSAIYGRPPDAKVPTSG